MNNIEFAKKAVEIAKCNKTCYMLGSFGHFANVTNISREVSRKDVNNKPYEKAALTIKDNGWLFDCCGIIKSILWGFNFNNAGYGGAIYTSNGVKDIGADTLISICPNRSTDFSKIRVGDVVHMKGHIGIYVGNGEVVESTPRWNIAPNGVKITKLLNLGYTGEMSRNWTDYGSLPFITYIEESEKEKVGVIMYKTFNDVPEWAKEAVKWFMDNKYLNGDGEGNLNLSKDLVRVLVILYRVLTDKED